MERTWTNTDTSQTEGAGVSENRGKLFRLKFSPEDIEKTCRAPCNKCSEKCDHNLAFYKQWGPVTCWRCCDAYYCFELAREGRKAIYQPKSRHTEGNKKLSQESLDYAAAGFRKKYGLDWKDHLKTVFPEYQQRLNRDLSDPPSIRELVREGRQKGRL